MKMLYTCSRYIRTYKVAFNQTKQYPATTTDFKEDILTVCTECNLRVFPCNGSSSSFVTLAELKQNVNKCNSILATACIH